jgi:hypothetical protein
VKLDLRHNALEDLPLGIGSLTKLEEVCVKSERRERMKEVEEEKQAKEREREG